MRKIINFVTASKKIREEKLISCDDCGEMNYKDRINKIKVYNLKYALNLCLNCFPSINPNNS